jgi:hypothetical protein
MNKQTTPDPRTNADYRFVHGPYRSFAYPYQVFYPAYTYPKIDRRYGIVEKPIKKQAPINTSSLQSVVNSITGSKAHVTKDNSSNIDDRMLPYMFRHYRPPNYFELWDYNKNDMIEYQHNEALRLEIAKEVYNAPGSWKKIRR